MMPRTKRVIILLSLLVSVSLLSINSYGQGGSAKKTPPPSTNQPPRSSQRVKRGPTSSRANRSASEVKESDEVTLVSNQNHIVYYSEVGNNIVISIESIVDDGWYIAFDLNKNRLNDDGIDVDYFVLTDHTLGTAMSAGGCGTRGDFPTKATLRFSFAATQRNPNRHYVYKFTIPKGEIIRSENTANAKFVFGKGGYETAIYPGGDCGDFTNTYEIHASKVGFQ